MEKRDFYSIIMAGGLGSRFWPISRNSKPKQFLDLLSMGKTFLQSTYDRVAKVIPHENIIVVTASGYRDIVIEQLPNLKRSNLLLEPYRRNTLPCVAYASYKIRRRNPNALIAVTPSDHLITDESLFAQMLESAMAFAKESDKIVTLGVEPNRAETAYGYIQINRDSLFNINGHTAYGVKTFTEKPNEELAKIFIESREFLWNSGIFVAPLKRILQEIEEHQSDVAQQFERGEEIYDTPQELDFIYRVYQECKNISIDYGIMEKTENSIVYPLSFGWSDIGSWETLYSHFPKDESGNVVRGKEIFLKDSKGSIVISSNGGRAIVASNLTDFMVIDTPELLLISPKEESSYKMLFTEITLNELKKYQ
ncbi:MAG: sugar phosphate nucleotidyltransferase [Bacteroidales bacterium]